MRQQKEAVSRRTLTRLGSKHDDGEETTQEDVQNSNWLETRLDATLASIHGLCRFLIFDFTTGTKMCQAGN